MPSDMCTYTHVLHNKEILVGQKTLKKILIETTVHATCQGNLSVFHFGQICFRFANPVLEKQNIRKHFSNLPFVHSSQQMAIYVIVEQTFLGRKFGTKVLYT
jgi:hypothetical protein